MTPDPSHRRDFVRTLVLGGSAASLSAPARGDDEKETPKDQPPKPRSEADARMDLILARHGKFLDEDARRAVRSEVEAIVKRGEQLRAFELTNGDEPFPVFEPYRAKLA